MIFGAGDLVELAALHRHLLHDVLGVEDGLQVEPALLAAQPRVQDILRHVSRDTAPTVQGPPPASR